MNKSVFISRQLSEPSEFAVVLQTAGWQLRGFSLVTLTPLPLTNIPEADWIFFASQQAVKFFFEANAVRNPSPTPGPTSPTPGPSSPTPGPSPLGEGSRRAVDVASPLPQRGGAGGGAGGVGTGTGAGGVKYAAIGPATARALLRHAGRVDFTGSGDPATTAEAFRPLAKGLRVLFPAARHSRRSVPNLLGDDIVALHLAVYDNAPLPDPLRLDETVLVFTSPMNAKSYFSHHPLRADQRVVAIGKTTASALVELGIAGTVVVEEPTELALARAVLALVPPPANDA